MHYTSTLKSVCFTGHRPKKLLSPYDENCDYFKKLRALLRKQILIAIEDGCTEFYCGMAMGTDLIAGQLVLDLTALYPNIHLNAVCPYPHQSENYPDSWIGRYMHVLSHCEKIHIICGAYVQGCFAIRNRYLVDNSDKVISVWDGKQQSGTAQTIRYAHSSNKPVVIIRLDKDLAVETIESDCAQLKF